MFRVEFSDGFYITRNGGLFIDGFARDVSLEEIKQLCDLLNSAQQQNAVDRAMPDEPAPQAKRPPTDGGVGRPPSKSNVSKLNRTFLLTVLSRYNSRKSHPRW